MKRLAKKLLKLQSENKLVNEAQFLGSPQDFEWLIRTELLNHANRMNICNKSKPSLVKHLRSSARKRLHTWLDNLEAGIVNHL